jgi:hypothetical protein
LNDIQITSDYMSRWVVLKRRVGAVTSQRIKPYILAYKLIFSKNFTIVPTGIFVIKSYTLLTLYRMSDERHQRLRSRLKQFQ